MARYFQHLNSNSDLFQTVTKLEYIDNTDPDFVLFYFADGTKCNKEFIGKMNDESAIKTKEYIEVSNPSNKWVLEIKEYESTPKMAQNANGEMVEVADLYSVNRNSPIKPTVNIIKKPIKSVIQLEPDSNFYIVNSTQSNNSNSEKEVVNKILDNVNKPVNEEAKANQQKENNIIKNDIIDLDNINSLNNIKFKFNYKEYSIEELLILLNEKIKIRQDNDEHLKINLDPTQRSLIDNMIAMSTKETCDIEMLLTMSLPPVTVYQLIKSVYPNGMSNEFVNIIADSMKIKELKYAVANGLLAYYNGESITETIENEVVKQKEPIKKEVQKAVKKKSSNTKKNNIINITEEPGESEFIVPVIEEAK